MRGNDRRAAARAAERADLKAIGRDAELCKPPADRIRLRDPAFGQCGIEGALKAALRIPLGLAMTDKIDFRATYHRQNLADAARDSTKTEIALTSAGAILPTKAGDMPRRPCVTLAMIDARSRP
ncbi:hypothetical protein BH10PSE13_BH10PSE13_10450 [soil metagenome]